MISVTESASMPFSIEPMLASSTSSTAPRPLMSAALPISSSRFSGCRTRSRTRISSMPMAPSAKKSPTKPVA